MLPMRRQYRKDTLSYSKEKSVKFSLRRKKEIESNRKPLQPDLSVSLPSIALYNINTTKINI